MAIQLHLSDSIWWDHDWRRKCFWQSFPANSSGFAAMVKHCWLVPPCCSPIQAEGWQQEKETLFFSRGSRLTWGTHCHHGCQKHKCAKEAVRCCGRLWTWRAMKHRCTRGTRSPWPAGWGDMLGRPPSLVSPSPTSHWQGQRVKLGGSVT